MSLQSRIDYSIALLRKAEPLALKMHPDGFHLAFSGGKDSQVLYHIAQMAGVKFKAHMQITTLDPPELMRFIRKNYPEVVLHRPEINFYQLIIKKKMLPLRHARYCCAYLKESAGAGTCTLIGIRAAESIRRAKRNEVEVQGYKFDILRKRAMAAIGGYLKVVHRESSAEIIKGIACRATGYATFNKIPAERLRNLYSAFSNKQSDIDSINEIASGLLEQSLVARKTIAS